ncbi:succinyldiaminopimelate transaminase [Micromonospora endophytica]|uniref:Aminotransferase n=1 Tax=Micromonospora endophytica TaxID=515350 RepID=A0A2W2DAL8_9ACTN|nr:succinyldiaminopimelate transaminase [Micromonospora endophytica]RIW44636.1 succinyldiaminopimelate transaminase [Micromonospora endophytica]
MEGLHRRQLRVLRGPGLARWRFEDRQGGEGRFLRRRAAAARRGPLNRPAPVSSRLPEFTWDTLDAAAALAAAHPDGLINLSMGTPVDPVPEVIRRALAEASDTPGYPLTAGTPALRAAIAAWVARACGAGVDGLGVLPTIGSKELVAWLPTLLGIGPGDVVVVPSIAYPTYEDGVRLAGATTVRADSLTAVGPTSRVRLVWVNSPGNPTGRVLPATHLRKVVDWARERGAVVASDECYLPLGWEAEPVSVLSPEVCGGSYDSVLAVHSLSKRSNLAGYRAGFVAGDPALVAELLKIRKHAGMIVPAPVQAAMVAALHDEEHADEQRERYRARRETLRTAFTAAGFTVEHSEAGLYLWLTRGEDCWETVDWLARRGILVAAGVFYGPGATQYVRAALTESDERISAVAARLSSR